MMVPWSTLQEHPQTWILTDSIFPVARRLFPGDRFTIGQDRAMIIALPSRLDGAKAPIGSSSPMSMPCWTASFGALT